MMQTIVGHIINQVSDANSNQVDHSKLIVSWKYNLIDRTIPNQDEDYSQSRREDKSVRIDWKHVMDSVKNEMAIS